MTFTSERQLCEYFKGFALSRQWLYYPETHGFDIVCVDEFERRLGIQAKLKDREEAIAQVGEAMQGGAVDVGAILMPEVPLVTRRLCRAFYIAVFVPMGTPDIDDFLPFSVWFPGEPKAINQHKRSLPSVVPEVPAGVPSPRKWHDTYTPKELRLEVLMRRRGGWANKKMLRAVGLDPDRNRLPDWLHKPRDNHWELVIGAKWPSEIHPLAFKRIEKEMKTVRI